MSERIAKSLGTLREQINKLAPNRSRVSDGWIGDRAHRSRKSDHNANPRGVVQALDITHDPAHGIDGQALFNSLKTDPRVKYLIFNRKIWTKGKDSLVSLGRAYSGSNPHTKHIHVSASDAVERYDDPADWDLGPPVPAKEQIAAPAVPKYKTIKKGAKGEAVKLLQQKLGIPADGKFGPKTHEAVVKYQRAHPGLIGDGIVGPYTWDALLGVEPSPLEPQLAPAGSYSISRKGKDHIKEFEGWREDAHLVSGLWHIGYGHSETSGRSPVPKAGMSISRAEGEEILSTDLSEDAEPIVKETITAPITQGAYDALVSLAFNRGKTWFRNSDLAKTVNAGDLKKAEEMILAMVPTALSSNYRGLSRRRKAEAELFRS